MNAMKKWPCGHQTSVAYAHLPSCPVCALEQGLFVAMVAEEEEQRRRENERARRESLEFSRAFNRAGCPYCGGIW